MLSRVLYAKRLKHMKTLKIQMQLRHGFIEY